MRGSIRPYTMSLTSTAVTLTSAKNVFMVDTSMVSRALMASISTLPMPFQAKMVSVMVEPANS